MTKHFEPGQHIYSINHGAEGYELNKPAPATYLRTAEDALTLLMFGTPMHEVAHGHVEVTKYTPEDGLAYRDELFATYEEAEAAL